MQVIFISETKELFYSIFYSTVIEKKNRLNIGLDWKKYCVVYENVVYYLGILRRITGQAFSVIACPPYIGFAEKGTNYVLY